MSGESAKEAPEYQSSGEGTNFPLTTTSNPNGTTTWTIDFDREDAVLIVVAIDGRPSIRAPFAVN